MFTLAHWAGDGPGPWILLVPLFWAAVVTGVVVLLRRTVWRRGRGGHGGPPWQGRGPARESAGDLLARRFAAGEIDEDEYWLRLSVLNETKGGPGMTAALRSEAAARVVDAVKVYGRGGTEVRALDGVSVDFPAGRFTAIMGPSGSGKSTLMHCAAGLDAPTTGRAYIGGTELGTLGDRRLTELRRDRVGFVFQAFNLLPTLTVAENITLPQDLAGTRPDPEWTDRLTGLVGLRDRLHHRPAELSGGQQQRVAVARALAGRPDVVFADEPTGNLDSRSGAEVLDLLAGSVRELGRTVVMVTHDPVAAAHADEVIFLADGRLAGRLNDPTAQRVLDRLQRSAVGTGPTPAVPA